jgi:hypothetical protein
MCDFFLPASSLQPLKHLEIPNPQSKRVAMGQYFGCEITCTLGSWSREISDSSLKAKMYIRNVHEYFKHKSQ